MFENIPTTSSAQRLSPSYTHTLVQVVHTEGRRGRWRDEKGKWGVERERRCTLKGSTTRLSVFAQKREENHQDWSEARLVDRGLWCACAATVPGP